MLLYEGPHLYKAVSLLPRVCLLTHTHHYVARVTQCKYKRIGCPWKGPFHELPAHEDECSHPTKTGTELMGILGEMDQNHRRDMQLYNTIFSLLCYEKIGFTGTCNKYVKTKANSNRQIISLWSVRNDLNVTPPLLVLVKRVTITWDVIFPSLPVSNLVLHLFVHPEVQFRPYRTDDFITRLYYETPRFTVLNQTWVLKARVNDSERNPNLSCKRTLSFQLLLKSKVPFVCELVLLFMSRTFHLIR